MPVSGIWPLRIMSEPKRAMAMLPMDVYRELENTWSTDMKE